MDNGKLITYTVRELDANDKVVTGSDAAADNALKAAGYTSEVTGDVVAGFTMTNAYKPVGDLHVAKTWNDAGNESKRSNVKVHLYKTVDGVKSHVGVKEFTTAITGLPTCSGFIPAAAQRARAPAILRPSKVTLLLKGCFIHYYKKHPFQC
jgi:hypothetical protein